MTSDTHKHEPRSSACRCDSCKGLNGVHDSLDLSSCSSQPDTDDVEQTSLKKPATDGTKPDVLHPSPVMTGPLYQSQSLTNFSDSALFGDGTIDRTQSDSTISYESCQSTQTECTCRATKSIYVTVADDSNIHVNNVADVCKRLKDRGYDIKFDYRDEFINTGNMNVHEWRDASFLKAHRVLICISPKYYKYTFPDDDTDAQPYPNDNRLAVRYVFNLIRNEIQEHQCINRRFVPVVFTDVGGTSKHVPHCLRPFGVMFYPEDRSKLTEFILNSK